MVESRSCVQREGVYRWFSTLTSAQRAEFLCGLLDLCVPIELRFLGSCLEDLARKDYHSLRDAEIKANNPADLSGLTNVTDEVVRSKLLVSLALLGTDNREAAGVLYRTLTHIDTVINNYGLALNEGRTEEQFLLLFTMASNHPAFNFHQKQVLRHQLGHIQDILQASRGGGGEAAAEAGSDGAAGCYGAQPHHHYHHQPAAVPQASLPNASATYLPTCYWHKNQSREASTGSGPPSGAALGNEEQAVHQELPTPRPERRSPPPPLQVQDATRSRQEKAVKAVIERVVLRRAIHKPENGGEYVFEVGWSDGFTSSVVRTQQEVAELISQLSQVFPDDGLETFLPRSVEVDTRCLAALPGPVLQHHSVQLFFTSSRPLTPSCPASPLSTRLPPAIPTCSTSNSGCMVQYRGANRAVYRVASVQPVVSTHSSVLTRSPPHLSSLLSPPTPLSPSMHHLHPPPSTQTLHLSHSQQASHSPSLPRSQSHPAQLTQNQSNTPEQNGILDWLRKLRLHKYYPVFKQLTMEEFLALTEEDLNKYDLTQGAKKKLKTQLELHKSADREMKTEKRPCSGIARVTPSSHMGISVHPTSTAGELRVEVDGVPHLPPPPPHLMSTDSSSSWMSLCCDSAFDRSRDAVGRPNAAGGTEKERYLLSSAGPARPTAQVLPVQTEPAPPHPPSCSSYHPFSVLQTDFPLQPSFPTRVLSSPRKPRPSPLGADDRSKPLGAVAAAAGFSLGPGVGVAARLESQFSGLGVADGGPQEAAAASRTRPGGAVGLMVETSSALTSTSNSLHHVSQPPLLFHLSSSPAGYHIYPPAASAPPANAAGNQYYQSTSSPALPTSSPPSSDHNASVCVCSSCGCRGNCSPYAALPGYATAGYLQPSLFTLGPLLHLSPLIASSSAAAPPFSYPMMVPPPLYRQSPTSHDQQQGFGFYQPHGIVGNGGQKRAAGNMSCYNCGGGGHRAEDCKQPAMDSAQQGTFRLKFTPHSQSKDSGE
ncbi:zinc finger CCHC domain-containing protein 14 [Poecilia latipinna]|uniref:Zinc finger CCHC-type containing 14 n=1 Tax=Poecilia latipinna TaxID=48699 RepID=A0A3B3UHJ7_9TELE|nr:PREDICTED: zinc finger CCHC domain-containing protein 14 [Poecilia latipinna]